MHKPSNEGVKSKTTLVIKALVIIPPRASSRSRANLVADCQTKSRSLQLTAAHILLNNAMPHARVELEGLWQNRLGTRRDPQPALTEQDEVRAVRS
jgi:hypothetical protein